MPSAWPTSSSEVVEQTVALLKQPELVLQPKPQLELVPRRDWSEPQPLEPSLVWPRPPRWKRESVPEVWELSLLKVPKERQRQTKKVPKELQSIRAWPKKRVQELQNVQYKSVKKEVKVSFKVRGP